MFVYRACIVRMCMYKAVSPFLLADVSPHFKLKSKINKLGLSHTFIDVTI